MASDAERRAWLEIIKPSELDEHMASIGQAEANAGLVKEMFRRHPLQRGSKLLIHGCGSCQMLDFLSLSALGDVDLTLADLSPGMLEEAKKRLTRVHGARYRLLVDDVEHSALAGSYDAVLLVLVLLHVDWKQSLENLMHLNPHRFCIIEQEQPAGVSTVTVKEELLPSMKRYSEVSEMALVPRQALTAFMEARGYRVVWSATCAVPGDKAMMGFVFEKQ